MTEIKSPGYSADEIFCLRFELEAMADLAIRHKAERWVPGFIGEQNEREHRSRYELAAGYVEGKNVLDLACGSGFGAFYLAEKGNALHVFGGDIDEPALRYGDYRYPHARVTRGVANAQEFQKPAAFDIVVSFETIEHLVDYNSFLKNVYSSLKDEGTFIVSTPVVQKTTNTCINPYHKIEWSFQDFQDLISSGFSIEKIYVQSIEMSNGKPSLLSRALKKANALITGVPGYKPVDPLPVLFSGQYPPDKIQQGYQILICKKK